ncbi:MAG: spermidine/putrescine ABC transporter substrate-binding protein, partial [Anaerolineae bacterium]|nr:spermidine/putrescine ABC transporter substrate-binding protein [Anaerolineae bacterium]
DFEQRYGVTIIYSEFDSDEQLLADLRGGLIYDLIVPTDILVPLMRREGLLARLNHENIPNLVNLAPNFANPLYDPQNRYSVPYQ